MAVYDVVVTIKKSRDYKLAIKSAGNPKEKILPEYTNAAVYEITVSYSCSWEAYETGMY